MGATLEFTNAQRRARLVARHHLARTAEDVTDAVRGVVASHSSDPITPYLGAWARVPGFEASQLEHALYEARSLCRVHGMRRTLFVVPADDLPVVRAGAADDVARKERRKLVGWLEAEMDAPRVPEWMDEVEQRTLKALGTGEQRTQDLTAAVAELNTKITVGSGKWTAPTPVSSRLLFLLALDGRVVRTRPAGSWRSSQYRWAATTSWFPEPLPVLDAAEGRAALVRRYLAAHGPATLVDVRWWTGWTAKHALTALGDIGALPAGLEGGGEAFVLPGDTGATDLDAPQEEPQVALLGGLDSTPMGWKQRDWYVSDRDVPLLFDRNGNVGPTVWVDGRAVGAWAQRPGGEVVHRLLEDVGSEARGRVEEEAAALTRWLAGTVVTPRFRGPLERELST